MLGLLEQEPVVLLAVHSHRPHLAPLALVHAVAMLRCDALHQQPVERPVWGWLVLHGALQPQERLPRQQHLDTDGEGGGVLVEACQ